MTEEQERNATVVCPICGCLYDHDELVRVYESGDLLALKRWTEETLAAPGNREPSTEVGA